MKVIRAIVATIGFVLILTVVYFVHVNYFRIDVVFYAALFDVLIAAVIAAALMLPLSYFVIFGWFERVQLLIIWLLIGYALAISVPTVIDRSLSFYILEKIQQRGGGIQQDAFEYVFTHEYVKEHRLVEVRLTEQLESGTIVIENGCVLITQKGQRLASFSRAFREKWLPKRRQLLGEYSDALVDPFMHSVAIEHYSCH